ncbi:Hint domain-containing protein [Jannaschia sp. GRR-S6-38]|uniref:Hint domain-containing protein n=1 Tax=Jannaschia ovalis TaxID=3038773 RepID=A0ABY8LCG8_9RHOB|nr:Hint domain-containing protein [Jannaschia sp. GRR-S6-38]WGH79017.1 Hint domain-containing protein [Jannaschia sp. GRR-S6-38]
MAIYDYYGYDDDQVTFPGGTASVGETITFTAPSDHLISISDNDTQLQDGTDDRDDEDGDQIATIYDEFGNVETSGQVQPREEIALSDGTNTVYMTRIFIASSNSYYYIFQEPAPDLNTTYTVTSVTSPNSTNYSEFSSTGVACFVAGTLIATPAGPRPVETLRPGDPVSTLDRGRRRWSGPGGATSRRPRSGRRRGSHRSGSSPGPSGRAVRTARCSCRASIACCSAARAPTGPSRRSTRWPVCRASGRRGLWSACDTSTC